MKPFIRIVLLVLCTIILSCEKDVEGIISCDGNCNVFKGRVYTADNVGLSNVTLKAFYLESGGLNPREPRLVARTKTDSMGNFSMEGFIKDEEFIYGGFYITIDESKVESQLSSSFFKPSEIYRDTYDITNRYYIFDLVSRDQIITADYLVPYKATITINLNDFNPVMETDSFGVGNGIEYGFIGNHVLTKLATGYGFAFANGVNTTIDIPAIVGANKLRVSRFTNGSSTSEYETVIINGPNENPTRSYSF